VNTMMALSILKGNGDPIPPDAMYRTNGDPIPPDAMYRTILHTIAWGGMTCTIRAGSLVECLKAKADFDYSRDDYFDWCEVQRHDGKNIVMSPALERWLAYGA